MEIKILGVCSDPDMVDRSFVDFVTTKDSVNELEYDYIIDLDASHLMKDPRPFIKSLYDVVYSDFVDKDGVNRLSGPNPTSSGVLVKKNVYELLGFDTTKMVLYQYVPQTLFKINR